MPPINCKTDSAHFKRLLADEGLFEAMRFLNSKSAHRFTALYCFDGPILRNLCLVDREVDRENDSVRQMEPVHITDSYCMYVHNSGQRFVIPDSRVDQRVQNHPKQESIQSYCGMPLKEADNPHMLGTLCHFDFAPIPYSDDEILLLEMVTPDLIDSVKIGLLQDPERS